MEKQNVTLSIPKDILLKKSLTDFREFVTMTPMKYLHVNHQFTNAAAAASRTPGLVCCAA